MTSSADFRTPSECRWDVDGLTLRGLSWGEPGAMPVLALHGWLDNAASFTRLAPQLEGCHVVAVDLSGQGRSSFRSPDATYQIWDDVPQLAALLDQLGWQRCALLGHSRGGIISTLLAASLPERISHLVMLDAVVPQAVDETAFPRQLGRFVHERQRALARTGKRYATWDEAIAARVRNGLPREAAQALASRSLEGDAEGGWEWRIDPRLRAASAVKMSDGQIRAVLGAIRAPALLLQAREGMMQHASLVELARAHMPQLQVRQVDGSHHFHMEPDIDPQVPDLLDFLAGD
ncbi:alpha/beta hydrolase [Parahaliea maris]|uniref:Alpha/beta hydrolase n=1 Tax=Parahaliea maris TaxID=2716870 RepID=A0A5C9A6J2_9GAMM|nr:alpha/beta hydrolase [Parahaliea maris]TXS95624.1 alpha/beta hydrolase [Parahaliea maris]